MQFVIKHIECCPSTNTVAAAVAAPSVDRPLLFIVADEQTAGRGQKGNSWEAEPGKNLTFSAVWRPVGVAPAEQFAISEAVALSVVDLLGKHGVDAKVKWPNDIYVDDRKICGILIEHSLLGSDIMRTIAGVGINVNQEIFLSDAPNPVSMKQLTEIEYDLAGLINEYARFLSLRLKAIADKSGRDLHHQEYMKKMWRFDSLPYPFRDVASGKIYKGVIMDVELSGHLHVRSINDENQYRYAFKEVEFLPYEGF
ncbi:MAG: biotin--[acetyl-CoA-carboxylase] ligase [Muribaculaceae bacterium]|nr:biotin--[acetyl-CoA-carboxylase] ligase [Muribaculaceae bacterium]